VLPTLAPTTLPNTTAQPVAEDTTDSVTPWLGCVRLKGRGQLKGRGKKNSTTPSLSVYTTETINEAPSVSQAPVPALSPSLDGNQMPVQREEQVEDSVSNSMQAGDASPSAAEDTSSPVTTLKPAVDEIHDSPIGLDLRLPPGVGSTANKLNESVLSGDPTTNQTGAATNGTVVPVVVDNGTEEGGPTVKGVPVAGVSGAIDPDR